MLKIVYKYKTEKEVKNKKLQRNRRNKMAYLVYDDVDDSITNVYHSKLNKLKDFLNIDLDDMDRSIITQINQYKFVKVCKNMNIVGTGIRNIVVEHLPYDPKEEDLMLRSMLENKKYTVNFAEISNDKPDMRNCYMYLGQEGVLHFLTSARFIMLTKDIDVMRFVFKNTRCKEMLLDDFIFDPETVKASGMFLFNRHLKKLSIKNLDFCNIKDMIHMFGNCRQLHNIYFKETMDTIHEEDKYETKHVLYDSMFFSCRSLESLDLRLIDYTRLNWKHIFRGSFTYLGNVKSMYLYSNYNKYNIKIAIPSQCVALTDLYVNSNLFNLIKRTKGKCITYSKCYDKKNIIHIHLYDRITGEVSDEVIDYSFDERKIL